MAAHRMDASRLADASTYEREAIAAWLEKQGQKNPRRRTVKV